MHRVDLRSIDLNLLVALDVLLDERNVTRASERLGMSQPAVSRALARLRHLFADTLLVPGRGGYALSSRAEALRPAVSRVLADLGAILAARPFDPATAAGQFRILTPDLVTGSLAPPLLARLAAEAPRVDLEFVPPGPHPLEALETDAADVLVGVIDEAPAGTMRRGLYDDGFATLMRVDHPAAKGRLTLERFLDLGHIVMTVTGTGPAPVDTALAAIGRDRRVRVRVPSFLAAIEVAAQTDLLLTLPSRLVETAAGMDRFVIKPPPLALPRFTMSMVWHARRHDDPRHVWLRQSIVAAAGAHPAGRKARAAPR